MIPSPPYHHSLSLDLNQDHHYHQFSTPHHHTSSFSSYPPNQYCDLPNYIEEVEKMIPSTAEEKHDSRSMKQKLTIRWKKEESDEMNNNIESVESADTKMIDSDDVPNKKQLEVSPVGRDNSSSSSSNNYSTTPTVRVCSDCNTTKTPLWRSGPKGPKTLCNACGIRQRKARRAMAAAAAAAANGVMTVDKTSSVKQNKLQKKENKSKIHHSSKVPHMKKKRKVETKPSQTTNNFSFEDFTLMLSNNLAVQQVFPQDEKEAAILLMALSYGLVHG